MRIRNFSVSYEGQSYHPLKTTGPHHQSSLQCRDIDDNPLFKIFTQLLQDYRISQYFIMIVQDFSNLALNITLTQSQPIYLSWVKYSPLFKWFRILFTCNLLFVTLLPLIFLVLCSCTGPFSPKCPCYCLLKLR